MKKYKVDHNFRLRLADINAYIVESIYDSTIYAFDYHRVCIIRGSDAWVMTYKEAEILAEKVSYPPMKKEFKEILSDVRWNKRRRSVYLEKEFCRLSVC